MDQHTDGSLLVQDLIYAGMEALRAVASLDLCAYLHVREGEGPQLFLSVPDLASIEPAEAFSLFSALRDLLEHEHAGDETVLLSGFFAAAVTAEGRFSRGLYVVGRRDAALEESERGALTGLARSLAGIIQRLEAEPTPSPSVPAADRDGPVPVRVAVESSGTLARAEVAAQFGEEVRTGTGESGTPTRAVATAVIDAVDASLKLVDAVEGEIAGERAIMVMLADQWDRRALGASLVGDQSDPLRAAAVAALDAATRLSARGERG